VFRDRKLTIRAMDALQLDDAGRSAVRDSRPAGKPAPEYFWDVVTTVFEGRINSRYLDDRFPLSNIATAEASDMTGCSPAICAAIAEALLRRLLSADMSGRTARDADLYDACFSALPLDLSPQALRLFKDYLETDKSRIVVLYLALCYECGRAWDAVRTLEQFRAAQSSLWYRLLYSIL